EGTYRVRATKSGAASVTLNVTTDVDVVYLDQFEVTDSTGATGNLLDNDDPGSSFTTLQVFNGIEFVDTAGQVTVDGVHGTLTVDAEGNYSYSPHEQQDHFNEPVEEVFTYQLTHPSGEVATGTLTITVEPSGAGVAAAFIDFESLVADDAGADH